MENFEHLIAGQYKLHQLLSKTSLGKLFRAQNTLQGNLSETLPDTVLILAVEPTLVEYPNFANTLARVLEHFAKPDSPLPVINACHFAGTFWIVLPDQTGELLIERLQSQDVDQLTSLTELQTILLNILRAKKRVMPTGGFGFIEPGSILCHGNTYKLLTAPLAVTLHILGKASSINQKTNLFLTSAYISPEVAQGALPTPKDDTFSLACIAYQYLQGTLPFKALSTLQAVNQNSSPTPITSLKPEIWVSLQQALNLSRFHRQISPYELMHAFTETPLIMSSGSSTRISRRSVYAISAVLTLAIGLAGLIYNQPITTATLQGLVKTTAQHASLSNVATLLSTPLGTQVAISMPKIVAKIPNDSINNSGNSILITSEKLAEAADSYRDKSENSIAKPSKFTSGKSAHEHVIYKKKTEKKLIAITSTKISSPPLANFATARQEDLATNLSTDSTSRLVSETQPIADRTSTVAEPEVLVETQPVYVQTEPTNRTLPSNTKPSAVKLMPTGDSSYVILDTVAEQPPVKRKVLIQTGSNTFVVAAEQ